MSPINQNKPRNPLKNQNEPKIPTERERERERERESLLRTTMNLEIPNQVTLSYPVD